MASAAPNDHPSLVIDPSLLPQISRVAVSGGRADTGTPPALIVSARVTLGLADQKIGTALGVGAPTVRRWERGDTHPRGRHLRQRQIDAPHDFRALLAAVVATPEAAQTWVHDAAVPPRDITPRATIIARGDSSIARVVGVLASMESGAFL